MWGELWGLPVLVWWGLGLVFFGAVLILGVAAVEAGFRKQWECPAEPDTMPARFAAGQFPALKVSPPATWPGLATTQEWRDWDAARIARPGRHRWQNIGEETRLIVVEEMDRAGWEEGQRYHPWPPEGVRGPEVEGHEQAEGGAHRQRRQEQGRA